MRKSSSYHERQHWGVLRETSKHVPSVLARIADIALRENTKRLLRPVLNVSSCAMLVLPLMKSVLALRDDPNYVKALQRRASSNDHLDTWSSLASAQEGTIHVITTYLTLFTLH